MSAPSSHSGTPLPSPAIVEALHHPEMQAQVVVPHDVDPLAPGVSVMGGKALLAKKMAASGQSFYSPTDTLVSPCTAKLHLTKQMRFAKMTKPNKPALLSAHTFPGAVPTTSSGLGPQVSPTSATGFLHPDHARAAQAAMSAEIQQSSTRGDDAMDF